MATSTTFQISKLYPVIIDKGRKYGGLSGKFKVEM